MAFLLSYGGPVIHARLSRFRPCCTPASSLHSSLRSSRCTASSGWADMPRLTCGGLPPNVVRTSRGNTTVSSPATFHHARRVGLSASDPWRRNPPLPLVKCSSLHLLHYQEVCAATPWGSGWSRTDVGSRDNHFGLPMHLASPGHQQVNPQIYCISSHIPWVRLLISAWDALYWIRISGTQAKGTCPWPNCIAYYLTIHQCGCWRCYVYDFWHPNVVGTVGIVL